MLVRSTILVVALTALAGCSISESLGLNRHVPDETQVVVRPPLTLPPDYDLLPPGSPTPVSDAHEAGLSMGQSGKPMAEQQREKRGFFGHLVRGEFFGSGDDSAAPASQAPAPNVDSTPAAPPPAKPEPSAPAPAPTSAPAEKPGFFDRLFKGDIFGANSVDSVPQRAG